jgi:hypothetical protein
MEHNINFDSTYFVKLVGYGARYPYIGDWVECVIHEDVKGCYLRIIPCDDDWECVRMHFVNFEQMIADGKIIENVNGNYCIATYDCYEPLCGNAYLHHSAHYIDHIKE